MSVPQKLAIHGGEKTVKKTFPWPVFDESDVQAVTDVVRSGQWGDSDVSGLVARFEREFAAYCGASHAVASVNGSVAIRLALIAAGLKPGDEVIIPPYTFQDETGFPNAADVHERRQESHLYSVIRKSRRPGFRQRADRGREDQNDHRSLLSLGAGCRCSPVCRTGTQEGKCRHHHRTH